MKFRSAALLAGVLFAFTAFAVPAARADVLDKTKDVNGTTVPSNI